MKTTECFECGKQSEIIGRNRARVPLCQQAINCHWYECRNCGHSAWKWMLPALQPVYGGTGALPNA